MFARLGYLIFVLLLHSKHTTLVVGKTIQQRPDFVPIKILQYGCIPFKDYQCPATMECLVDLNYAYYGQCYCKTSFFKRSKAPHDTGLELHHPGRHDCVNYGPINIVASGLMFLVSIGCLVLEISVVLTIFRVWKHGGLKFNATTYAMILLMLATGFLIVQTMCYALNRAGWDPKYKFYDKTFVQTMSGLYFTNTFLITESICTWFDLWKRSTSMSKKTSAVTIFLRWTVRAYGVVFTTLYAMDKFALIKSSQGKNLAGKMIQVNVWTVSCITIVFGFLIRRVLCKNMKDVSNPNWKAASAIQTTALTSALCSILFQAFYKMSIVYGIYASGPVPVWEVCVLLEVFVQLVQFQCWFDYLLYCQRRYLESYDTSRISNYFGFSTIARKQSSMMMASAASSMQMMSAASSVAASSTVEADQSTAEKGSVA